MHDRFLEEPEEVFIWKARCGVCGTRWAHQVPSQDNPYPHGAFCPVCQDHKLVAPGVLNFKPANDRRRGVP